MAMQACIANSRPRVRIARAPMRDINGQLLISCVFNPNNHPETGGRPVYAYPGCVRRKRIWRTRGLRSPYGDGALLHLRCRARRLQTKEKEKIEAHGEVGQRCDQLTAMSELPPYSKSGNRINDAHEDPVSISLSLEKRCNLFH